MCKIDAVLANGSETDLPFHWASFCGRSEIGPL